VQEPLICNPGKFTTRCSTENQLTHNTIWRYYLKIKVCVSITYKWCKNYPTMLSSCV